jgi:peptide deformylase
MKIIQGKDLGHSKSREATASDIATAQQVVDDLNEVNGSFEGAYKSAFALSHNQVEANDPARIFFVAKDFVENTEGEVEDDTRTYENWYFPAQAIFNPRIEQALPTFLVEQEKDGKKKKVAVSNIFHPEDACMSFPYRKPKKVERFLKIIVHYQIAKDGELVDVVEECEGLKAHIFQHEIDHHEGIDIHFGDGERKEIPRVERYRGTQDPSDVHEHKDVQEQGEES